MSVPPTTCTAQPASPDVTALKQIIADSVQRHQPVPDAGIAVAVMQDRKLLYSDGFGLRDRTSKDRVDVDTVFAIGSATKGFTSMAMAILSERQAVDLGAPIKRYLPDFSMQDTAAGDMTLEDVLSHRTGLPRHDALWYLAPFSRLQLLHHLRFLDPNRAPGKGYRNAFEYNNMTYSAAAYVLEAVTGVRWEEFVKANILDKLQMSKTSFTLVDFVAEPNRAKGYLGKDELAPHDFDNIGPAAALNSNVRDLANWALLHLNRGTTASGTKVVDAASLEMMYDRFIDVDAAQSLTYGLGWFVDRSQGKRLVYHGGDGEGYTAYLSFMPDDGLGVVALTNQHTLLKVVPFAQKVAGDIYEYLQSKGGKFRMAVNLFHTNLVELATISPAIELGLLQPTAAPAPFTGTPSDYIGIYSHEGYGDLSIGMRGNNLWISYYRHEWPLTQIANDLYYCSFVAFGMPFPIVPVVFNRTLSGQVEKVTLPLEKEVKPIQFLRR
jgi:CubicO group peptidase (beta-lactamase class C family)